MTMARFAYGTHVEQDGRQVPEWIAFIREVNTVRPGTFKSSRSAVDHDDLPADRPGYQTEHYPTARVIHPTAEDSSEGVRIVADDDETREAFRTAARNMKITIAD